MFARAARLDAGRRGAARRVERAGRPRPNPTEADMSSPHVSIDRAGWR